MTRAWIKKLNEQLVKKLIAFHLQGKLTTEIANGIAGSLAELVEVEREMHRVEKESSEPPKL